ncbi:MAG: PKD domain-containing protein [Ginsengibacter sp.]
MKACLASLLFLLLLQGRAQQYNNWYFGQKAGVSFNNPVNPSIPVVLNNSAMDTRFACSSISDTGGNLLFYTNGVTVYNHNHQVMLNGDGLEGNIEAEQGCTIIQHPAYDSIYYIFTTDIFLGDPTNGYQYSVVDMAGDNGNGRVTSKNILLFPFNTERLTAARHADGIGVWLITNDRFSNIFRAWLITCNGLQPNPVISVAGEVLGSFSTDWTPLGGIMKVSPDGKQLCQTQGYDYNELPNDPKRFFQLFDFDNATGKISRPRKIVYDDETTTACEYSTDSKYLYIDRHSLLIRGQTLQHSIDQIEAKLNTEAEIIASRIRLTTCSGSTCSSNFSSLQTGPDGKIYLNRKTSKLSVISYPNAKGLGCTFELDKTNLGNNSGSGLPSMINDGPFDPYNNITSQQIDTCKGIVQFNGRTAMTGTVQWLWDFGDGTTSTLQNPQHTFTTYNQPYNVKLTITSLTACGYIVRKNIVYPRGTFTKAGFDFVVRCDSSYVRCVNTSLILPDTSVKKYSWDFGDGNTSTQQDPVHHYATSGVYQVKLKMTTTTACIADSITKALDIQQLNIQASPDQSIDAGQPVQLFVTGGGSRFQWSPARWLSNAIIANPIARPMDTITYTVTATDDTGCKDADSVTIQVKNHVEGINVPTAFTPNNDGLNDIIRPLLGSQYTLKEFSIFNRWGQQVFSTSEPGGGWDGSLNGRPQDTSIYAWILKVTDAQNKTIIKNGTVVLIR